MEAVLCSEKDRSGVEPVCRDFQAFVHLAKSFPAFAFTAASLLTRGGQGCLKPGNFFHQ